MVAFRLQSLCHPVRSVAESLVPLTILDLRDRLHAGVHPFPASSPLIRPARSAMSASSQPDNAPLSHRDTDVPGLVVELARLDRLPCPCRALRLPEAISSSRVWLNERGDERKSRPALLALSHHQHVGTMRTVPSAVGDPSNTSLFILCGVLFSLACCRRPFLLRPDARPPRHGANFDIPALTPLAGRRRRRLSRRCASGPCFNLGGVSPRRSAFRTARERRYSRRFWPAARSRRSRSAAPRTGWTGAYVMVACGIAGSWSCLAMSVFDCEQSPGSLMRSPPASATVLFPIYALERRAMPTTLAAPTNMWRFHPG